MTLTHPISTVGSSKLILANSSQKMDCRSQHKRRFKICRKHSEAISQELFKNWYIYCYFRVQMYRLLVKNVFIDLQQSSVFWKFAGNVFVPERNCCTRTCCVGLNTCEERNVSSRCNLFSGGCRTEVSRWLLTSLTSVCSHYGTNAYPSGLLAYFTNASVPYFCALPPVCCI